jgi:hypothetical protein
LWRRYLFENMDHEVEMYGHEMDKPQFEVSAYQWELSEAPHR